MSVPAQASPRPVVVLDTNVWLDLLVFDDPRCALLKRAVDRRDVDVIVSDACADELRHVAARSRWDALQPALMQAVDMRLNAARCVAVMPFAYRLPRCRDASDQKFVELAVAGRADALVSKDRALLKLARKLAPIRVFATDAELDRWLEAHSRIV